MNQSKIRLSNADKTVDLPGAQVIGISTTAMSERSHGRATIRFLLKDQNALGVEPFGSVSDWFEDDAMVGLKIDDLELVKGCKVREYHLNISSGDLYIQLFVPFTAQEVRGWFITS